MIDPATLIIGLHFGAWEWILELLKTAWERGEVTELHAYQLEPIERKKP